MDEKLIRKKYDRSGNKATMLEKARKLRREMTNQEKKLWYKYLRFYRVHWYKQYIISGYILDFYCHSAKLAIEIDGLYHSCTDQMEYDEERTIFLYNCGIDVMRFTNDQVDHCFGDVCDMINTAVSERLDLSGSRL